MHEVFFQKLTRLRQNSQKKVLNCEKSETEFGQMFGPVVPRMALDVELKILQNSQTALNCFFFLLRFEKTLDIESIENTRKKDSSQTLNEKQMCRSRYPSNRFAAPNRYGFEPLAISRESSAIRGQHASNRSVWREIILPRPSPPRLLARRVAIVGITRLSALFTILEEDNFCPNVARFALSRVYGGGKGGSIDNSSAWKRNAWNREETEIHSASRFQFRSRNPLSLEAIETNKKSERVWRWILKINAFNFRIHVCILNMCR